MTIPGKSAAWRVLVTGGAGFIGSRLVRRIENEWPNARVTVVDDFRSGSFKNLEGFTGDLIAEDVSVLDFGIFKPDEFDAIFHLASITDTTEMDQRKMCLDNIEGFRNILNFARPTKTPITYASSAAVYGIEGKKNAEDDERKPANVYGFSKAQLENLTVKELLNMTNPDENWKINGVRYFNVYGPHEQHKGKMASMIYQLYLQMKDGQRPRIFKMGEQQRDFVHVDDAVDCTIRALASGELGVFNVGSGEARPFNDVIARLNKELGLSLEPDYIDNPFPFFQPFTQADLSRSSDRLGYTPEYNLDSGVKHYVEWLESNA